MRQLSLFPSDAPAKSEPRVATLELVRVAGDTNRGCAAHQLAGDTNRGGAAHHVPEVAHGGASLILASRLSSLLREPVEVELTDNAWTMVSYRRVQGRLQFRLHHMFAI